MTVRLYTLSGMRLANGCGVPQGCDLDRPTEPPPLERFEIEGVSVPLPTQRVSEGVESVLSEFEARCRNP